MTPLPLAAFVVLASLSGAFAQATPMVADAVSKVDADAGKITLDHAAIPNLDMGAMKMVFKAGDPASSRLSRLGTR